ncbi:hypothetical protein [Peribacillus butanolivorans]|uniref:Uncharacterized protein n=1 Tax=Peribacillus butanolivorans TaxID=421767 RepID=A0ABM6XNF5_9BACI|nr:hypothetical protein [Peribacillus butanolivorans]AXN39614.1 hypothetical protein DTO10_15400 [Peribacillus butanolivorans]
MTADQIFKMIKELDNGERWKFLEMMYDEYYNSRKSSEVKKEERLSNLEKDIEFLSRKVGVHEMYFNRIHKKEEEEDRA